ncbi:MAG TPA: FecR domain-containing protein [Puia sp.]|nr:FecR domain-containing protein [Puia sp.]
MNLNDAKIFVARFITGDHSPGEHAGFLRWLEGASTDDLGVIADEHEALQEQWSLPAGPSSAWVEQLESKLDRAEAKSRTREGQAIVRKFYAGRKFKWIAAASLVGLIAGGGYLRYAHQAGSVAGTSDKPVEVLSKSFSTPRGGNQQRFELADGSKVWLNSASTLKYPASFSGKERSVELSGEAYFEVAKYADMPFRVKVRDAKIEVLGTDFNVMAYEDEPVTRTTLVDGAVKVVRGSEEASLKPGDQAEIAYPLSGAFTPIRLTRGVNTGSVISWKNGDLEFRNDDLHTVMREIARCYDVEVRYEGNIPEKYFTGNFSRKDDLRQILKQLEYLHIHFRITGKTITVTS